MKADNKQQGGFALRGIVEGFFGPPWKHSARLRMIDFMADAGFNSYIYAPKDDPYHRDRWSEDYPGEQLRQITALIRRCSSRGVDFCWAVSPGLSISYSSRSQFDALCAKMLSFAGIGVKDFALFLDDIPEEIQHAADRAKYPSLAAAHADLANRLLPRLAAAAPGARLWFCPTAYFGVEPQPYLATLGKELDPAIDVFWTGPQVVSPEITAIQAGKLGKILRRKPLLWDNYPVNDYNRSTLNIGPLRGRDAKLSGLLSGYFSNPMNEAEASRIPLLTVADYLRNPAGYDPDASFRRAVKETCSEDAVAPMELMAAWCGADVLSGAPNPMPEKILKDILAGGDPMPLFEEMRKIDIIAFELESSVAEESMLSELLPQAVRLEKTAAAVKLAFQALNASSARCGPFMKELIPLAKSLRARHRFVSNAIAVQEFVFKMITRIDPKTKIENWTENELFVKGIMN